MRRRLGTFVIGLAAMLGASLAWVAPASAANSPWEWYVVSELNLDGREEEFWTSGNTVYHRWRLTPGGAWSGNYSLGCCARNPSSPEVDRNQDGRLEVFIVGTNNKIYHRWQTCAGCGWNPSWAELPGGGTANSNVATGTHPLADGLIDVFVRGTTGLLHHNKQVWQGALAGDAVTELPLGIVWTGWIGLGSPSGRTITSFLMVWDVSGGRLQVLAIFSDNHLWSRTQTVASGLGWDPWTFHS